MSNDDQRREFDWRLTSLHEGDENVMTSLEVELMREQGWIRFEPRFDVSPYLVFLYSAFTCQLAYLRMNASERDLELERVTGECHMVTEGWRVTAMDVEFTVDLRRGSPSLEDLDHLRARCLDCPVSRNLDLDQKRTKVLVGKSTAT